MVVSVPLSWLIIGITLLSLAAGFAAAAWLMASRFTQRRRQPASQPEIPPSALASLAADQAELFSTVGKLTTTVKRLSSRAGMEDLRSRNSETPTPPAGTSKAELLRHYGMAGKVGPAFAQAQLELENRRPN